MKNILRLLTGISVILFSCNKTEPQPDRCLDAVQPSGTIFIKEIVGDTAFLADTVFRNNLVFFEAVEQYDSLKWQIGTYSKVFKDARFGLNFANTLENIPVNFTGYKKQNPECFPDDKGIYTNVKNLQPVEQYDRATLTISPLVGQYHGFFTDNPADTFTVRIEYFDSTKYNTSITGTQNFYWISNIPKGYVDSTSIQATTYPELSNGLPMKMGYKGFVFGRNKTNCEYGRGWLSNDSLYINYGGKAECKKQFLGKRR